MTLLQDHRDPSIDYYRQEQRQVDQVEFAESSELNKFQKTTATDSMERMLEKHNKEPIKKTMQIQEQIFKHQVHELHRLYSVQKRLMGELTKESKQSPRIWSSSPSEMNHSHSQIINSSSRNLHHTTAQTVNPSGYTLHFQNVIMNDARERSGSCSGETLMKNMARASGGFYLGRPAAAASTTTTTTNTNIDDPENAAGPSNKMMIINNGSDDDDDNIEDSEVELTLSIGASPLSNDKMKRTKKKKKNSKGYQLQCLDLQASFKSDRGGEDSSCPNTPLSSSSATTTTTTDQEKKMPHWLFGLNINRS